MRFILFVLTSSLSLITYTWAQNADSDENTPPFECDNNYSVCGTPEMSGGGGGGGGSILIANTDLGDSYQNADDFDDDGVEDAQDNCPRVRNLDQVDSDGDGFGDVCDNCLSVNNVDQFNKDGDDFGDACDLDLDGDQIDNSIDNCPAVPNPAIDGIQLDLDGDSLGDACDEDIDGDGIPSLVDSCPLNKDISVPTEAQFELCFPDTDKDGVFDFDKLSPDNCVNAHNPDQLDTDGDGIGDVCDNDDDNDKVLDLQDNCPLVANFDQLDDDRDLLGNQCDPQFCYVVYGNETNCLDPQATLQVYSPSLLATTGKSVRLRLFANRDSQEMNYAWRIVKAPNGAGQAIDYAQGVVGESTPFEYRYAEDQESIFVPEKEGEYEIEITVTTVGADIMTDEFEAQSTFIARIYSKGAGSEQGCTQTNNTVPHLLFILLASTLFVRRRHTA